jgi:exonuclease SbcC
MRLRRIVVAGFRGFAVKQEFDLSADATIVVGVNGLGKTSLFDAILWCLSGKLPRVGEDNRVVSLYSTTGEANVSLLLEDSTGREIAIRRNSDGSSQSLNVKSGERDLKGASAASFLADSLWPEAAASTESESLLNSAICRGVYLQQDCIREFLDATTDQERFNIISQLIGTGQLTEFQLQLEKQRTSWTRATTQLQKVGAPIEDRVDALKRQLE